MAKSEGALRRRIELRSRAGQDGAGEARAAVEDDFHHFRVVIRHDGAKVRAATAQALRFPYTTCPAAGGQLAQLEGMALSSVANSVLRQTDAALQCTHMLDLAGLAVAAAARGIEQRRYDCTIPDRVDGLTHPTLERDGAPMLAWAVQDYLIVSPAPYDDRDLKLGFAGWALRDLPEDEAEAALVLRRATVIANGRVVNRTSWAHARSTGFCYSQQPDRAPEAITVDSDRDWPSADLLCAEDQDFLAFAD